MTPEQRRAIIYGRGTDAPPKPAVDPKNPLGLSMAPAGKSIVLKLQDQTLIAASAMHAKELEDEVVKLQRQVKNLESANRRLMAALNKTVAAVRQLEVELANKLDKTF